MTFDFRGLELHGRRMWERRAIVEALDVIARNNLNALVLHETDMLHQVLFPRAYFDPYAEWKSAPTRRGENAIQNNRVYLDHVLNLASARGIEVWLEIKELGFPDEVVEMQPELLKDGRICPSEPFWQEFLEAMVDELYADFPAVAGLIVSTGSPEGRASRAQNKCGCELCGRTDLVDWYLGLIQAMWRPTAKHGKRLAVRDFAYKPSDHEPLIAAVGRASRDIVFCIKATPHDFYPTFPDNPAFGRLDRAQWMEYEVLGQFYGLGVVPCFVFDDIRRRLQMASDAGATGVVFRVEWERVNDWWALGTLNEANLIAGAMVATDQDATPIEVCRRWLDAYGWPTEGAEWLAETLIGTWPVVSRALYIDGFLFADSSFFPRSVGRAWWTMETKHSLAAWAPERARDLDLDGGRIEELLAEKAEASMLARAYARRVRRGDPTIPEDLHRRLVEQAAIFEAYIEGFEACARVCLLARAVERGAVERSSDLAEAVAGLEAYGNRIRPMAADGRYPHQVALLLDTRRVTDVARGGRDVLATTKGRA